VAGEQLEEVLDQVPLAQPLDQLDLLDRDRRQIRDRARELDFGGRASLQYAEELVIHDERNGHARRLPAAREFGPDGAERERCRNVGIRRRGDL